MKPLIPFEVTIPLKTTNTQNGPRRHWAVEATKRKSERRKVLSLVPRLVLDPALVVTLTRYSSGTMDDDGLRASLKSVRDAVAYRLGVDDRTSLVRWEYRQERAKPGEQAVRIQVQDFRGRNARFTSAIHAPGDPQPRPRCPVCGDEFCQQREEEALRAIGAVKP